MKTRRFLSYNFIDKDPIIDEIGTAIKDSGMKWSAVEENGGPKLATMRNWFLGDTRRPQFATVRAALRAIGTDLVIMGSPRKLPKVSRQDLTKHYPTTKRRNRK